MNTLQPLLSIVHQSAGVRISNFTSEARLCDGVWHSLEVTIDDDDIVVKLDKVRNSYLLVFECSLCK